MSPLQYAGTEVELLYKFRRDPLLSPLPARRDSRYSYDDDGESTNTVRIAYNVTESGTSTMVRLLQP